VILDRLLFRLNHKLILRHRERSVAIQSLTQKPEFVTPLPAVAFLRRLGGLPRRFAPRKDDEAMNGPKIIPLYASFGSTSFVNLKNESLLIGASIR